MTNRPVTRLLSILLSLAVLMTPATLLAQEEKPFAQNKFVLQISDMDPFKQTLVLNVAGNIIKHYGQDQADVEIVAFGPGLRLLFEGNANSGRIEGLKGTGVRFAACQNTINNMSKTLGTPIKLNNNATPVVGGVVRIAELVEQDYLLIKP